MKMTAIKSFAEIDCPRGETATYSLTMPRLFNHGKISMPVIVNEGAEDGPCLVLSATIHGDELNGLEIIRRVQEQLRPQEMKGRVIATPVVNVYGFLGKIRALPDGRDLNRTFPGSRKGSLASQVAWLFSNEIVLQCTHLIDLHCAANNRNNLPQIRANLKDAETLACAEVFGAPFMMNADTRDGSLREYACEKGIKTLLYEAGEILRFNPEAIDIGVEGILRVLDHLGIQQYEATKKVATIRADKSKWVRARRSGVFRLHVDLGDRVEAKQQIGEISDPIDATCADIHAPRAGIVIGKANCPLVYSGDPLVHIAFLD